ISYLLKSRRVKATFIQFTAFIGHGSIVGGPQVFGANLSSRLGFGNYLDVAILAGLGFATLRKQRWAGWSLVIYQAMNTTVKLIAHPFVGRRRPDRCGKRKWRIFSVGLESTTVTPLAGRTERRYADVDVATEGGCGQAGRARLGSGPAGGDADRGAAGH